MSIYRRNYSFYTVLLRKQINLWCRFLFCHQDVMTIYSSRRWRRTRKEKKKKKEEKGEQEERAGEEKNEEQEEDRRQEHEQQLRRRQQLQQQDDGYRFNNSHDDVNNNDIDGNTEERLAVTQGFGESAWRPWGAQWFHWRRATGLRP